ncbi:MAG: WYL domain-containing protein [Clostridia bacterium]|nr:WYL domain-containing protein [Clostridia bacterium]
MDSLEHKKSALLRILQILQRYSDESHPLKQEDMIKILDVEYGIPLERKAIGRNIQLLKDAGVEIESTRAGSWLSEREFTDAELRMLIDGVLSSKYVPEGYSKDLINKLCGLTSKYFRSHIKYIYAVGDWDKTDNQQVFLNIELIDEAIEQGKQIRFEYHKYGIDKKLHKNRAHHASPYQLILHNQRYYLMAQNDWWKDVTFYRLDRMKNMTITEKPITPITEIEGYKDGINYKELSTALPYMFSDKPVWVEFIADEDLVDQIIDWFGKDIRIDKYGDKQVKIAVKVSPSAMEHWALQYAGYVTVTSPQSLVESIKKRLQTAVEKYND